MKRDNLFSVFIFTFIAFVFITAGCGGESDKGNNIPVFGAPSAPSITAASGQLTVTWAAVAYTDSYKVFFSTTNDSGSAVQYGSNLTITACLITGLTNGTPYYVWVKSVNSTEESGFSPVATGTPVSSALDVTDVVYAYGTGSTDTAILRMSSFPPVATTVIVPADTGSDTLLIALPSVSLNRKKLAYLDADSELIKLFNSDTGTTTDITPSNLNFSGDFSMIISPDGSKLAYNDFNYNADPNPNYHIWVISTGSGSPTPVQLTNCTSGIDKYPTWSPDGTRIAFIHFDSDFNAKIYSIKADGTSTDPYGTELFSLNTTSAGNESLIHLAWSPVNPFQMVCSSRISGTNPYFCIYTLNLTTKERYKLTGNTALHEFHPQWSKDGNYIFYQINNNIYYNSIDNSGNSGTQMTTDGMSSFYGWAPSK